MILRVITAVAAATILLAPVQSDPPAQTSLCELAVHGSAWDGRRVLLTLRQTWGGGMHGDIWWDPDCPGETASVYFDFDQDRQDELGRQSAQSASPESPSVPQDFELVVEATTSWGPTMMEGGELSRPLATLRVSRLISARPIGFQYWCVPEVRERMRRWGASDLCSTPETSF